MDSLGRRLSILIADDNRDLAKGLSILLKHGGCDVETVYNGRDAVAVARLHKPDVLLLDIGLPILDGYQVTEEFRGDAKLKDVVIIAISAYSPDMQPGHSGLEGFDHYLVKPVDIRTLLPLISKSS